MKVTPMAEPLAFRVVREGLFVAAINILLGIWHRAQRRREPLARGATA